MSYRPNLHPSEPVTRALFDEVMVPNYAPAAMIPVKGHGSRVWDQAGNEYIDLAGGIAVSALGHTHPKLISALNEQASKLWHLSNVVTNEPALRLAKLLVDNTFAEKVFFANSGAEANEAAFKLVRRHAWNKGKKEKNEIISFYNSFHGRTLFTVSVGGQNKYREGFEPVPEGIQHATFNDIESLKAIISEKTCAVVLEPIQGEGGVVSANHQFLKQVRDLCDQYDALLVFDEIQTGVGRTGELYAYMNSGVVPDVLTTAKALGGGFPIAAMLTTTEIAQSLSFGTHGSTYGGNPLGCAVAEALMQEVMSEDLLEGVKEKGDHIRTGLKALNDEFGLFKDVRGEGLLIGAELIDQWHGRAKTFLAAAAEEGLMILVAGPNVLRMAPSLIIPDEDIKLALSRLRLAIKRVLDTQAS